MQMTSSQGTLLWLLLGFGFADSLSSISLRDRPNNAATRAAVAEPQKGHDKATGAAAAAAESLKGPSVQSKKKDTRAVGAKTPKGPSEQSTVKDTRDAAAEPHKGPSMQSNIKAWGLAMESTLATMQAREAEQVAKTMPSLGASKARRAARDFYYFGLKYAGEAKEAHDQVVEVKQRLRSMQDRNGRAYEAAREQTTMGLPGYPKLQSGINFVPPLEKMSHVVRDGPSDPVAAPAAAAPAAAPATAPRIIQNVWH